MVVFCIELYVTDLQESWLRAQINDWTVCVGLQYFLVIIISQPLIVLLTDNSCRHILYILHFRNYVVGWLVQNKGDSAEGNRVDTGWG